MLSKELCLLRKEFWLLSKEFCLPRKEFCLLRAANNSLPDKQNSLLSKQATCRFSSRVEVTLKRSRNKFENVLKQLKDGLKKQWYHKGLPD